MIVSTKGRYALRVMVSFAQRGGDEYIPLKEIAEAEEISQKYLETIMTTLSKAGFVDAVHGKGGGYRLSRKPEEYTIGSILKLTEGSLAVASCTTQGVPYYTLQLFDFALGQYSVTLTLASFVEDNTTGMLELFYPVS